jgi:hypothetical protein
MPAQNDFMNNFNNDADWMNNNSPQQKSPKVEKFEGDLDNFEFFED